MMNPRLGDIPALAQRDLDTSISVVNLAYSPLVDPDNQDANSAGSNHR